MSVLNIVIYPHPALRQVAAPVTEITSEIKKLVKDMCDTMYEADGVGLAANQINVLKRIIVVDCSEQRSVPMVLINPNIVARSDESVASEEGCLSFPEVREGPIVRSESISVEAWNAEGKTIKIEADGLLARCIQHEIDHLDGKVYVDYLSSLKRDRLVKKMNKLLKEKLLEEAEEDLY